MKSARPRIVVSNWVHDEVIARLAALGEVRANRTRPALVAEGIDRARRFG